MKFEYWTEILAHCYVHDAVERTKTKKRKKKKKKKKGSQQVIILFDRFKRR